MKIQNLDAQKMIYSRRDVRVKVRDSAWFLYQHELEKQLDSEESILTGVLAWMDSQREIELRRQMEPTSTDRQLLQLLILDGLTMKEIALKQGASLMSIKRRFKSMRRRIGDVTLYQLVALSVKHGWVQMQN